MNLDIEAIHFLRKKLAVETEVYVGVLTSGSPKTYDAYKEVTGVIKGLAISDAILSDLENAIRTYEDE